MGLGSPENDIHKTNTEPCKKNQKEVSTGQALCAVNFITSGPNSPESYIDECKEITAEGTADKTKLSDNCSLTQIAVEECKEVSLESVKDVEVEHVDVTNQSVSQRNEDISDTHQDGASSTSETFSEEVKLQDMTNSHSKTEINPILSEMNENNHTAFHNEDSDERSDIHTAGQTLPDQSINCIASTVLSCKQISTYQDEIQSDNSYKINRCELRSDCNTQANTPQLSPLSNSLSINTDIVNVENVKQPGNICLTLREVSGNASEDVNEMLNEKTESVCEPLATDLKVNTTTDEVCAMVCDEENILLQKRADSSSSSITEEITVMGNMEDSHSSPIKNAEGLVNVGRKLFFDHKSLDKIAEKVPASLHYQDASQTASYSRMPFLLKQKIFSQEIKHTDPSKISQSLNMNAVARDETLGKNLNVKSYFKALSIYCILMGFVSGCRQAIIAESLTCMNTA